MSFSKFGRASTSSVSISHRGGINGSRFVRDENKPKASSRLDDSKSGGYPQGRASQDSGLGSRGTNTNRPMHTLASSSHLVPPQRDDNSDVPGWARKSEPNFLDLTLEKSDDDSEATSNTIVDQPLVSAPSGFTLPTRGECSKFLTLEVIEQPSSLLSASHDNGPQTASPTDAYRRLVQHSSDEQDGSFEVDLQLEAELAKCLADLDAPVPGPSRANPDAVISAVNASPSACPAVNLKLEVVKQPSPTHTSVSVGGRRVVYCEPVGRPQEDANLPTPKPKVSFKEKATELRKSAGSLLAQSKPLPPRNSIANLPLSTTGGLSSAPNPHSPRGTYSLFTPKGFSHHVQKLREKGTEDNLRRFHERYRGATVERAGRSLTGSVPSTRTRSRDASEGTRPTEKRQVQRTAGGRRISKAQTQAEEVMKICRSTKSHIVDMSAIKRREAPTLPEPRPPTPAAASSARTPPIRSGKAVSVIADRRVDKAQPPTPLPVPQVQSQLLSTSLGGIPRGLKFTRKQRPAPMPGETTAERVPLTVSASKRRWENPGRESEESSRKKPRLGWT